MASTLNDDQHSQATVPKTEPAATNSNEQDALGPIIDRKGKTLSEEQLAIFQRYSHWRANLMCLYNHIECYALPYPARTVRFLPNARNIMSAENQYPRYANYPFMYPSHCLVPKQDKDGVAAAAQCTSTSAVAEDTVHTQPTSPSIDPLGSTNSHHHHLHRPQPPDSDDDDDEDGVSNTPTTKMTPVFYLQSMHYFTANRVEEQTALRTLFHRNRAQTRIDLCDIRGIRRAALTTGILPFDSYMHGGASVESAYDVYRLRVMPQQPHLVATRSYHEDVAIYWFDFEHTVSPLNAFDKLRQATHANENRAQNVMPERSGLTHSDDEESDADHDDGDDDDDVGMRRRGRKRAHSNEDGAQPPTKRAKLRHINRQRNTQPNDAQTNNDGDNVGPGEHAGEEEEEEEDENLVEVEVGGQDAYLIAVGQTSQKTRIGWALAFNPQHAGMFVTGNSDGSIACWDLNMVDNSQCMSKVGKYRNKKHSADPAHYMKHSKIQQRTFGEGPPFISRKRSDEYLWFEEFEKYGIWGNTYAMNQQFTNLDVMSVDWCSDSSQVFVSCSANGQISIWDRRNHSCSGSSSKSSKEKKPAMWTWGTSHNQAILSVAWNPIQHSLLASGDKSKHVRIWDIRAFNRHCVQLAQHDAAVYHVQWCPYNKFLLASSGADNRVLMYDLRRSGMNNPSQKHANETSPATSETHTHAQSDNQPEVDSMEKLLESLSTNQVGNAFDATCPELVFAHCGHTACIPEFDWCPSDDLTMISTDMDGIIHTWQPPSGMLNTFAWVLNSQKNN